MVPLDRGGEMVERGILVQQDHKVIKVGEEFLAPQVDVGIKVKMVQSDLLDHLEKLSCQMEHLVREKLFNHLILGDI